MSEFALRPVTDPDQQFIQLERRSHGRIVTQAGQLEAVYGRWLPYHSNLWRVWWDQRARRFPSDRCELYYHTPWSSPGFLTLSYVRSGPRTSLSTFYAATLVLDEIARLKHSHAIVCNVTNQRISPRLMQRWGWQAHCTQWSGRHYIKRFYGQYPAIPDAWIKRLRLCPRLAKTLPLSQSCSAVDRPLT